MRLCTLQTLRICSSSSDMDNLLTLWVTNRTRPKDPVPKVTPRSNWLSARGPGSLASCVAAAMFNLQLEYTGDALTPSTERLLQAQAALTTLTERLSKITINLASGRPLFSHLLVNVKPDVRLHAGWRVCVKTNVLRLTRNALNGRTIYKCDVFHDT